MVAEAISDFELLGVGATIGTNLIRRYTMRPGRMISADSIIEVDVRSKSLFHWHSIF